MNIFTYRNLVSARLFAVLTVVSLLMSALPVHFFVAEAAVGEVNTVTGSCGMPVNANQYEEGQAVLLKGKNFEANTSYDWDIAPAAGGPNAVPIASGQVVTDANGDFCFTAIQALDEGSKDNSPYKATVGDAKSDNFSVKESTNANGTITVLKVLENEPEGVTPDDFSFTVNGGDSVQFNANGSNASIQNLNDGPFTVVEVEENGENYTTSYVGCAEIDLTTDGATCTITNTYEIAPVLGCTDPEASNYNPEATEGNDEADNCTYPEAQITLLKEFSYGDADPVYDSNDFTFYVEGGEVTLSVPTTTTPGTFTISEDGPVSEFDLTIECDGGSLTGADLTVVDTDDVTCTLTNTFLTEPVTTGTLVVEKVITDGSNASQSFDFSGSLGDFALIGGESTSSELTVADGPFTVSELVPTGWTQESAVCVYGDQSTSTPASIDMSAGETVTCTFTNDEDDVVVERGDIIVQKVLVGGSATTTDFSFFVQDASTTVNVITDEFFEADGENLVTVPVGTYDIREQTFAGDYIITYSDSCSNVEVVTDASTTPVCVITNTFDGGSGGNDLACNFTSSANLVNSGASFDLTWDTTGANHVEINQGIGSDLDLDGSTSTSITSNTTFTLTAYSGFESSEVFEDSVTCEVPVNIRTSGGGGGGGSRSPVCSAFDLDGATLTWETRRGTDLTITANGEEIFATTDNDVVDEGTFEVDNANATFELTVMRGSREDTCTIEPDGPTPQVLGEQVSVVPLGAANTGAGGTAPVMPTIPTLFGILIPAVVRVARNA